MSNTNEKKELLRPWIKNNVSLGAIGRIKAGLSSPNWYTRVCNEPHKASHGDLLVFAKHTGVPALELHDRFGLAKLTDLELDQLKTLHNLTQQSAEAA